jgi:hypothetical protein
MLMLKEKRKNQFDGYKRPTVQLTPEEHKKIFHYCIDNEMKIGEFLKEAALYCIRNKIKPKEK